MPRRFKKIKLALKKRVARLETQAKETKKTLEHKQVYYAGLSTAGLTWSQNYSFTPRLFQGVEDGNTLSVSATPLSRVGNSITLKSCVAQFSVSLPRETDGELKQQVRACHNVRIILVDNIDNVNPISPSDCLADDSRAMVSGYNIAPPSGKNYNILMDKRFSLDNFGKRGSEKRFIFKMKIPKSGKVIEYQNNVSEHPINYQLSLLIWSSCSTGSVLKPVVEYAFKSKYIDA